jgi:hypothetical protein
MKKAGARNERKIAALLMQRDDEGYALLAGQVKVR